MPSFVKLYSPTCGHCVTMQKAWDGLKNNPALENYNMAVIEVHANELSKINSPAMSVNGGFPTIRKVLKSGKLGKDYDGNRTTKDMVKFIKDEFKETLTKRKTTNKNRNTKTNIRRRTIKRSKNKSIRSKSKRKNNRKTRRL
jgi:hypothetical protein